MSGELAQRPVYLGSQQQAEEPALQGQHRCPHIEKAQVGQADIDRHAGHALRREELQHGRGQESDAQHRHRALAQGVAGRHDRLLLGLGAAIQLQRGQAAQAVGEEPRQPRKRLQVTAAGRLRPPPHQRHEQGDQRRAHQQQQAGDHIDRQHHDREGDRQHRRRAHGGQVLGEEGVQRLDLLDHGAGQFARGALARPLRAQGQQAREQRLAHLALDALGRRGAGALAQPGQRGARQHEGRDRDNGGGQLGACRALHDGLVQHAGQQPGLDDQQHAADQRRGAGNRQRHARRARPHRQPARMLAGRFVQRGGGIMLDTGSAAHSSAGFL
ncbi:Uncharacterised protein [Bordetella pertussis]|nr:hypothetical protein L574_3429 [Bordetella pertussis STO1-SEAT-0006]CFL95171.1 Uncharacterised protein [Bordetella pertussis]CFN24664.1 Uncharacterised protein [Bordetella pertussis]CFN31296.1 Uncharacterised protein [Bordetella pertussis]CFN42490.1 Uncharacterised protein [Bordetella pertussis]